mgnify:CR=1 FL=1
MSVGFEGSYLGATDKISPRAPLAGVDWIAATSASSKSKFSAFTGGRASLIS